MRRAFERVFVALSRRRRLLFLLLLGGCLAVCLISGMTMSVDEDITSLLPSGDRVVDDYRLVVSRFRNLDRLFFDIGLEDGSSGSADDIVAVADALFERLSKSGFFNRVRYRFSEDDRLRTLEFVNRYRSQLFTPTDAEAVSRRIAPDAIEQSLEEARRTLIEPQGVFLKDFIRGDPLGFRNVFLRKVAALRTAGSRSGTSDGRIWSRDERHILMIAEPSFPATNTWEGAKLIAFVDEACRAAATAAPGGGVKLRYAGGHRAVLDNRELIRADVSRTLTASALAILILTLLTYRRWRLVVLGFAPVAFGGFFAVAIFSIFTDRISGIVVGCGSMLVGIAIDYAIHILYRYDNFAGSEMSPKALARHLAPLCVPLMMGAGTTAAAFLSLRASSLPGQRQLGAFAAVGIAGALFFALVVLPQMLPMRPPRRKHAILPLGRFYEGFFAWHRRHGGLCFLLLVAVSVVCGVGVGRIYFDGDMRKMNGVRPQTREDEEHVISLWGENLSQTCVVAKDASLEGALRQNDRILLLLRQLEAEGAILGYSSVAPVLPSFRTQEANRTRWREFWKDRRAALKENVDRIGARCGFAPGAFEPFWGELDVEAEPVRIGLLRGTVMGDLLGQTVVDDDGGVLVLSTLKLRGPADYPHVAARIRGAAPDAILLDGTAFASHASDLVRTSLGRLGLICLGVVVAILFLFLGRLELVLAVLFSLGLSLLWTLGILGLFNIPINMMNSLFIIFIFGMSVDYAIFLVNGHLNVYRGDKSALSTTGGAITISALTTMFGFGALVLARHPALFAIGVAAAVGMGTGLLAALFSVPLVMRRLLWNEGRDGVPTIRTVLASAWIFGLVSGGLLFCRLIAAPVLFLRHPRDLRRRRARFNRCLHVCSRIVLACVPYGTRTFIGATAKAFEEPAVIVCNHQSPSDIIIALALPADFRMMVKRWVWDAPLVGRVARAMGCLLAEGVDAERLLSEAGEILRGGSSVLVFPEGTRSENGEMRRFKRGAFELAVRTGTDILPVVLCETRSCLPNGAFWIGDHRFVVSVLPRVESQGQDPRALAKRVRSLMQDEYKRALRIATEGKEFLKRIRGRYDYRGQFIERYVSWKLRFDPIYPALGGLVPAGATVLDLGCGYGLAANILAAQSPRRRILGVDHDSRKVAVASRAGLANGRLSFETRDIIDWPPPEADVALLIDALRHRPPDVQDRILAKVLGCLSKGGRLVMRERCDSPSLFHALVRCAGRFSTMIGRDGASRRRTFRKEEDYLGALSAVGFARVRVLRDLGRGSNAVFVCEKTDV